VSTIQSSKQLTNQTLVCWNDEIGIESPELVCADTAHAAFDKACHYFGLKLVHVPVDPVTFKLDLVALRRAINRNTVVIVGSAVSFPQGIMDPIPEVFYRLHLCISIYIFAFIFDLSYLLNH
jgi:glutamate/tyrosine decarboxylase-like PLP-dependent enzyme